MKFYSTNKRIKGYSFQQVLMTGQAPDKGLFLPDYIPKISDELLQSLPKLSYAEMAYEITKLFIENEIPDDNLREITENAYNFPVPIYKIEDKRYILRLDFGPTAAFKDFAARMMSRCMQYFLLKEKRKMVILVATSGDTGSAIADAFFGLENIEVIILYPPEVSERQRKQMTTLGKNITAIQIEGKFDDCQKFVKEAFSDKDLQYIPLNSANSINWGRVMPQIIYYMYGYSRVIKNTGERVIFSVPSGNFGNLFGGVIAKHMGLPVEKFIVSVNENDEFPKFLYSDHYQKVEPSINCISNAMNVGHPSNLARLIDLYGGWIDEKGILHQVPNMEQLRKDFWSKSVTDEETRETIKNIYKKYNYIMEAHGAVGWNGLITYFGENPSEIRSIVFETANPAKFPDEISKLLGITPEITPNMKEQANLEEERIFLPADYQKFKKYLLTRYNK